MPATSLPDGYRIEAFTPLRTDLVTAIGDLLATADPSRSFRLELRSGRILIAAPHREGSSPETLMSLGVALNERLFSLYGAPAEPAPDEKAGSCDTGGGAAVPAAVAKLPLGCRLFGACDGLSPRRAGQTDRVVGDAVARAALGPFAEAALDGGRRRHSGRVHARHPDVL